eukprot:1162079-Pelagomonas_calceolata.AAC.2
MARDPVNLSQFVVDLRSRHLDYWNQFTAPDPRANWSNSTSPVCGICDSDDIQDEEHVLSRRSEPQNVKSIVWLPTKGALQTGGNHEACCVLLIEKVLISIKYLGPKLLLSNKACCVSKGLQWVPFPYLIW